MADKADALICFWDGRSKGSQNMIIEANKRRLKTNVIKIDCGTRNYSYAVGEKK